MTLSQKLCRKSGLQQHDFSKFPREIYPGSIIDAHASWHSHPPKPCLLMGAAQGQPPT